ncbi:hypothetical protein C8J57DRAFT_1087659 [Mycena rebaudengoi]|nr:hypothetical protein C8J57DRAFT_1087659 [Mycena rebaudengoi]
MKPASSEEEDLMCNVAEVLESSVSVQVMRRYAIRSLRFMDAYHHGLSGKWAAFAGKKYPGHRTLPKSLFNDMHAAGYTSDVD